MDHTKKLIAHVSFTSNVKVYFIQDKAHTYAGRVLEKEEFEKLDQAVEKELSHEDPISGLDGTFFPAKVIKILAS